MRLTRFPLARPFVFALALLLGTAGCAGVLGNDFNLVSLEEEWQLGQQIERDLARQLTLVDDPVLTGYINQMGQQIVSTTPMRELPWRFYVVQDPQINAFNTPGGLVYVNTGLIAQAGSAAELASVIGHEVAHGVERHGTERMTQAQGINVLASLVLGQDPGAVQQIAAQIAAGGALAKNSRDAEREADGLGIQYMKAARYNPRGMADMFRRLEAQGGGGGVPFFSTHPSPGNRVQTAERRAQQLGTQGTVMNDNQFAQAQQRARRYQ